MRTRTKALLAVAGGALAFAAARSASSVERVPYEVVDRFDGVELRRYPRTVLVETTARDQTAAFRRLYRYLAGANAASEEVAMTAPVATRPAAAAGTELPMTSPVRTREEGRGVTMAFYLPAEYGPGDAPVPTDPEVRLVVEPGRTLAVRGFSWWATEGRVEDQRRALLSALADRGIEPQGDPALLQYDPPWTLPFLRTNEVVVPVTRE